MAAGATYLKTDTIFILSPVKNFQKFRDHGKIKILRHQAISVNWRCSRSCILSADGPLFQLCSLQIVSLPRKQICRDGNCCTVTASSPSRLYQGIMASVKS
jgi:hypothetical protein